MVTPSFDENSGADGAMTMKTCKKAATKSTELVYNSEHGIQLERLEIQLLLQ